MHFCGVSEQAEIQRLGGSVVCADSDLETSEQQLVTSSRIVQLENQLRTVQADYEEELAMQKAAHRREMLHSRTDLMQMLTAAEANCIPIDEEAVRRKYIKETEHIKVNVKLLQSCIY